MLFCLAGLFPIFNIFILYSIFMDGLEEDHKYLKNTYIQIYIIIHNYLKYRPISNIFIGVCISHVWSDSVFD